MTLSARWVRSAIVGSVVLLVAGPVAAADEAIGAGAAWWRFAGKFHPIVVHFPIALLIVAAGVELVRTSARRARVSPIALACLAIGATGAVVSAFLGWGDAMSAGYSGDAAGTLGLHRWLGIATAIVATAVVGLAIAAQRRSVPRRLRAFRAGVILAAALVGVTGHFGASLVHGGDYIARAFDELPWRRAGAAAPTLASADNSGGVVDFSRDVFPILSRRCFACHTAPDNDSKLRLNSREAMLKGGKSGHAAVVPGKPDDSPLITLVSGGDPKRVMPPRGGRLAPEQINVLRRWIAAGAPWGEAAEGEHWHWAYRVPLRPNPPPVKDTIWPRNPIDHFILARLDAEGLAPSPEADRATLIRRVSLDLIGLPPTPDEVDAFAGDRRPDAFERVVDRLLASPRFGERWARVWLDLARYADSHGYEKDGLRVAWPYRDWVIDSFNRDLPFDRFTIDQLAGDLLPNPTLGEVVATGFHRNTQINEEGGTDPEEFRVDAVIDRVNTTATIWLGATVGCAQCHDHKFDPVSQEDFFRFYAIFNQDDSDVSIVSSHEKRAAGGLVAVPERASWDSFVELLGRERALVEAAGVSAATGSSEAASAELAGVRERLGAMTAVNAMVMRRNSEPRITRVHVRGNFLEPGAEVTGGTPRVFGGPKRDLPMDRLALAEWLVDGANPLTPRVQVNRLWSQLFGRGLVGTEEDFGTQGEPPTHPELLDWLATEYVRQGWRTKAMLRLIVTSAAYRQSSGVTPALLERDPANTLLARGPRHRLEAEMIRDNVLAAAGLLSARMFGPSVFPPQPEGVWTQIYSGDRWIESKGEDRFRRGVYTFLRRTSPYPTFAGFDAPSREVVCTRRPRTTTPLQALTTLNDPQFVEAAAVLGVGAMRHVGPTDAERLEHAFRRCLARPPTDAEIDRLVVLLADQRARYGADPAAASALAKSCPLPRDGVNEPELAAWTMVCNVILNLDEMVTKE